MAGKPYPAIYELSLAKAAEALGSPVDLARVLCIGDGLPTDVRGANARGLDVLFVASGIHGGETIGPNGLNAAAVADLMRQDGLIANYAIADLVW
jgi:ribonucleotide monophosphatase NagD (HAD superfamily)